MRFTHDGAIDNESPAGAVSPGGCRPIGYMNDAAIASAAERVAARKQVILPRQDEAFP